MIATETPMLVHPPGSLLGANGGDDGHLYIDAAERTASSRNFWHQKDLISQQSSTGKWRRRPGLPGEGRQWLTGTK